MKRSFIQRPLRYSNENYAIGLIIVNVAVFFLNTLSRGTLYYTALIPGLILDRFYVWQFFTYMFSHGGMFHLLFNMLALLIFGTQVERRMGSREFLLFYLTTGTLAGVFSFIVYILTGMYGVILIGASGAVFGVLLAFAVFYPHANIYIFGIFPVRAPVLVIAYTIIELFNEVFGLQSGVAHLTHLAGFGIAYLYLLIRTGINPIDSFKSGGRGGYWR